MVILATVDPMPTGCEPQVAYAGPWCVAWWRHDRRPDAARGVRRPCLKSRRRRCGVAGQRRHQCRRGDCADAATGLARNPHAGRCVLLQHRGQTRRRGEGVEIIRRPCDSRARPGVDPRRICSGFLHGDAAICGRLTRRPRRPNLIGTTAKRAIEAQEQRRSLMKWVRSFTTTRTRRRSRASFRTRHCGQQISDTSTIRVSCDMGGRAARSPQAALYRWCRAGILTSPPRAACARTPRLAALCRACVASPCLAVPSPASPRRAWSGHSCFASANAVLSVNRSS